MIRLLDNSLNEIGAVESAETASLTRNIEGGDTLAFTTLFRAAPVSAVRVGSIAELDGALYDIVTVKVEQVSSPWRRVSAECEHVSYRLNGTKLEWFTQIGTPAFILGELLDGTGFTVGTVEFSKVETYSLQEEMSIRGVIRNFAAYIGAEVVYDGFSVSLVAQRGSGDAPPINSGEDILLLSQTSDENGISFNCEILNPTRFGIGDIVQLNYPSMAVSEQLRVWSVTYNPFDKRRGSLELGDPAVTFERDFFRIQTDMLIKGKSYYGVKINSEQGLYVFRLDGNAELTINPDTIELIVGGKRVWYMDTTVKPPLFYFDGELGANVVIANETITNNIYADNGAIANLTVDRLRSDYVKPWYYLQGRTGSVHWVDIHDEQIIFMVSEKGGELGDEQYTTLDGAPLFWRNNEIGGQMTTEETDEPVMVYRYIDVVTARWAHTEVQLEESRAVFPVLESGRGDENGRMKDRFFKGPTGRRLEYDHSSGEMYWIELGEGGLTSNLFDLSGVGFGQIDALDIQRDGGGFTVTAKGEDYYYETPRDSDGYISAIRGNGWECPITYS